MNKNIYVNIDTVHITLNMEEMPYNNTYGEDRSRTIQDQIELTKNRLTNVKTIQEEGVTTVRGNLRNYSVQFTNNKITLFGSLCKFYHDNNLVSLTLDDLKLALKMLAADSGLPIYRGNIVRIDLGINLITDEPVSNYFEQLDETSRWIRNERKTEVNYTKGNQSLTFYDKKQELHKHDPSTHHLIKDKNVLRIESRSTKQLTQTFKYEKPIKVAMLLSTTFRNKLLTKFINDYESINKKKQLSLMNATCVADIKNMTYYQGIEQLGGKKNFMKIINDVRKAKKWPYTKTSTIRQWISRVIKNTPAIEEVDSIQELNEMVASAISSSDLFTLN